MKTSESASEGSHWLLATPRFAVDFVGTQRRHGDALAGELPPEDEASAWVSEHIGAMDPGTQERLSDLRALLRRLLAAIVDSDVPPARTIRAVNRVAEAAPVTLVAQLSRAGVTLERTSPAEAEELLRADLARSALTLLTEPARSRLRLCRAPGCTLFFIADRRTQQWCSTSCGNRARVARHYHRHQGQGEGKPGDDDLGRLT